MVSPGWENWKNERLVAPAHGSALAIFSDNDGVTFEWTVHHHCCNVVRPQKPQLPPGYIPQKWQKCYGPSHLPDYTVGWSPTTVRGTTIHVRQW